MHTSLVSTKMACQLDRLTPADDNIDSDSNHRFSSESPKKYHALEPDTNVMVDNSKGRNCLVLSVFLITISN